VIISGYPSALYDEQLEGWNREEFDVQTRVGKAREVLWFNFKRPSELHDYRYLGTDFHDRLRIQRKIARLKSKLAALPVLERAAVIEGISLPGGIATNGDGGR